MNVAHRDLKPENILIDFARQGQIKVIDFGTSHHFNENDHEMHNVFGTPYYIAPEVLQGNYTEKCDLWSIGVILYILLCGCPPFSGSEQAVLKKVERGAWTFKEPIWEAVSLEAKDLVTKLLEKSPQERTSAKEALQHPWILQKVQRKFDSKLADQAIQSMMNFRVSTSNTAPS